MKKMLQLLAVACCFTGFSQSLSWDWVKTEEQPSGSSANCVAADLQGNVYVGGLFAGPNMSFGNEALQNSVYAINKQQCFLAKYDSQGNVIWAKAFLTEQEAHITAMKIDSDGSLLLTGFFFNALAFDGIQLQAATNRPAGFLARLSADGNAISAINLSSDLVNTTYVYPYDIDTDQDGNIYATGRFMNNFKLSEDITLPGYELQHYFLAKFEPSFQPIWAKASETTTTAIVLSQPEVAVAPNGDVFLSADFQSSIDFGSGPVVNSTGATVFCLAKFSADGTQQFLKTFSAYSAYVMDIKTDLQGNFYIAGNCSGLSINGSTLAGAGSHDCFVAKLDSNGEPIWANSVGGSLFDRPRNITINGDDLYVCGYFQSQQFPFGNTVLSNLIGSTADFTQSGFILRYDLDGNAIAAVAPINTGPNLFLGMTSNGTDVFTCGTFKGEYALGNESFSSVEDAMVVGKINSELLHAAHFEVNKIRISPNPVTDKIFVNGNSNSDITFSIFNIMGQNIKSGTTSSQIDVASLHSGIYSIVIDGKSTKFIKS